MGDVQVYDGDGVAPRTTVVCSQVIRGSQTTWTDSGGRAKYQMTLTFIANLDRDVQRSILKTLCINRVTLPQLDIFGSVTGEAAVSASAIGISYRNAVITDVVPGFCALDVSMEADEVFFEMERARGR